MIAWDVHSGTLQVEYGAANGKGKASVQIYDTVLAATGRIPSTSNLGLDKLEIELSHTGKILSPGRERERTSAHNVFALGDVLEVIQWHFIFPLNIVAGCARAYALRR